MPQLVRRVGPVDAKLIRRDSFLIFMFLFAAIIALVLRFTLPLANTMLAESGVMPSETFALSLADLYPMLVAFAALYTGALLVGTVFGFVLLDEKDDDTLTAMMVTPVSLNQYVLYRVGAPAILAFLIIISMLLLIGQALLPLWQLVLLAAGGSLTAPIVSLFFATLAENKVQGFAYSKFGGISGWTIMLGWFVPEPFQWLIGVFPPFWISKAYWMALEGRGLWWLVLVGGILLQAGLIYLLMSRFNKIAHR